MTQSVITQTANTTKIDSAWRMCINVVCFFFVVVFLSCSGSHATVVT